MIGVEDRVDAFIQYVWDFHEANGEWPTRADYADFLGRYERRSLPGVRAAINRGLIRYGEGDRLMPSEAHNQDSSPKEDV